MTEEEKAKQAAKPTTQEIINSIKDTPEMAALLNASNESHYKLKEDELGGKFMGKAYNNVDAAYMEGLGLKDRPKGLTAELVANLAKENLALKAKLGSNTPKEEAPKVDNTAKDDLYKSQLDNLQEQIAELNKTNEALTTEGRTKEVSSKLRSATADIKKTFNASIGSTLLNETIENRISKAVMNSKEVDGKTIYYNSEGAPFMELGVPMDASKVANEIFKDLVQVKTPGGNGSDKNEPHVKGDIVIIPKSGEIKSFSQFNKEFEKAARAKGLTRADEKYYELQRATSAHYNFSALPTE